MTPEDLLNLANELCKKYQYITCPISDKAIAISTTDRVARIILAISANPGHVIDVAFSPVAPPSEIALITSFLKDIIEINVTQDFYLAHDKEMYFGMKAMDAFGMDIYKLIEDKKFEEECKKDGDPLLDDEVFVVTAPLQPATAKDLKKKQMRKYSKLWEVRRGR